MSELGPTLLAALTAIAVAAIGWNRLRIGSIVVLVWATAAIALAQFPLFAGVSDWHEGDARGFLIFGTFAFMPAALLVLAAWRVPRVGVALARIPTSAWLATQATRFGGIFLIAAYLRGELPAEVGLVSGVLDVIVAASAIALALHLRRQDGKASRGVQAWAVLSLADFGWATLMIFASFLGLLALDPAPVMMGNPPLSIISLFALPWSIFVSVIVWLRARGVHGGAFRPHRRGSRSAG